MPGGGKLTVQMSVAVVLQRLCRLYRGLRVLEERRIEDEREGRKGEDSGLNWRVVVWHWPLAGPGTERRWGLVAGRLKESMTGRRGVLGLPSAC